MPRHSLPVGVATRAFDFAARLLPKRMRADVGVGMRDLFEALASAAYRNAGTRGVIRVWCASVADLLRHVPAEHRNERRHRRRLGLDLPSPGSTAMNLLTDLRHGLRAAVRSPLPTALVVVTLAVGIGATTAVFTLVNGVVLRPLNLPEPDELFVAVNVRSGSVGGPVSYGDLLDVRTRLEMVQAAAAYDEWRTNLTGVGDPERLDGALVSANFFEVLGVRPLLGRFFLPEEDTDGNDRVVVLSFGLWQRRFGGDPAVIGTEIDLSGYPHTIVGVTPPDFEDPRLAGAAWGLPTLWRPLGFDGLPADRVPGRGGHSYAGIVRLRDGVTRAQAQSELDGLMAALAVEFPDSNADKGMLLRPLHESIAGASRDSLWLLFGAVGLVLGIAVANVAGILIARSLDRSRETALRVALGARDGRLAAGFLAEGAVLAVSGAALGLGLAVLLRRMILASGTTFVARSAPFDIRVALFVTGVTTLSAIVCGLAPLVSSRRLDLLPAMTDCGRSVSDSGSPLRKLLVAAEVALAVVLLSGAALLGRSLWNLTSVDPGLRTDRLMVFELTLPSSRSREEGAATRFFNSLIESLESGPGIEGASTINILPLSGSFDCTTIEPVDGAPPDVTEDLCPQLRTVSPNFAAVAELNLIAGRFLEAGDTADSTPVAVISSSLARELWPEDPRPIGRRLWRGEGEVTIEVVGIADEVVHDRLDNPPPPTLYLAHAQGLVPWHDRRATVLVRTTDDPVRHAPDAVEAVGSLDPLLPVANLRSMREVIAGSIEAESFRTKLLVAFAASALLLAAIGVYGVIAYAVSRQLREVAIRSALGADRRRVLVHVLRAGMAPVLVGIAIGVPASLAGGRILEGMLYGTAPTDPMALAVGALLLLAVGFVAAWLPARRAGRVDPAEALRAE